MAERPQTRAALEFLSRAVRQEGVVSPEAVRTSESDLMQSFGQGQHAFAMLPSYRLPSLNNPTAFDQAGNIRVALMPNGGDALRHEACGWVRMYALTSAAAGNLQRLRNAVAFLGAFGGRDHTGEYAMAKRMFVGAGLPFCALPLYADPQVNEFMAGWSGHGGNMILRNQMDRVRNKDTISPWFGNWQSLTDPLWQSVCLGTLSPATAVQMAAEAWSRLQRARN